MCRACHPVPGSGIFAVDIVVLQILKVSPVYQLSTSKPAETFRQDVPFDLSLLWIKLKVNCSELPCVTLDLLDA